MTPQGPLGFEELLQPPKSPTKHLGQRCEFIFLVLSLSFKVLYQQEKIPLLTTKPNLL